MSGVAIAGISSRPQLNPECESVGSSDPMKLLEQKIRELVQENQLLKVQNAELSSDGVSSYREIEALREKTSSLESQLQRTCRDAQKLAQMVFQGQQEVSALRGALERSTGQVEALKEQNARLRREAKQSSGRIKFLERERDELNFQSFEMRDWIATQQQKISELNGALERSTGQVEALKEQNARFIGKIEKLKSKRNALREVIADSARLAQEKQEESMRDFYEERVQRMSLQFQMLLRKESARARELESQLSEQEGRMKRISSIKQVLRNQQQTSLQLRELLGSSLSN
ncbi:MAG: hypothetical protein JW769_04385 [Parachlamydiales bacterium]|nr:hypothetical protein [Parachlamydiales bacterium]